MSEHPEWFAQAVRDLEVARHLRQAGYYEWSSYAAQQAAEKAVKSLKLALGTRLQTIKVHAMDELLGAVVELAPAADPKLMARASELDPHNQGARYPTLRSAHGVRAPMRTYDDATAGDLISVAEAVVEYVRPLIAAAVRFWQRAQRVSPPRKARRKSKG